MKTFDQRVSEMQVPEDCDIQLDKAKKYAKRLHLKAKSNKLTLQEKLEIHAQAKKADGVLRKLRQNIWILEDMLIEKCQTSIIK
jgi:hypothetical protein